MLGVDMVKVMQQHVESHGGWPDDAVFAVRYKTKCWPCDFDASRMEYFTDEAGLKAWISNYADWARQDGNSVEYAIYEWDLGPNYVRSDWH